MMSESLLSSSPVADVSSAPVSRHVTISVTRLINDNMTSRHCSQPQYQHQRQHSRILLPCVVYARCRIRYLALSVLPLPLSPHTICWCMISIQDTEDPAHLTPGG